MLYCDLNELFFEQLYLEITNECNMQCDYCFNCSGKYEKKYLSIKEIYTYVSIKNFSNNLPLLYLSGGEPLLHPMFKEIVNYLIDEMKCKVVI